MRVPASRGARWGDLGKRVASALVLGPVALACIWFGGPAFDLLVIAAGLGLATEWVELCRERVLAFPGLVLPASAVLSFSLASAGVFPVAIGVVVLAAIAVLLTRRPTLAAGIPYFALGGLALIWIRQDDAVGRDNFLFLLLLIWASDIGAYLAGRLFGGPRMAPLISPGKTWSGAMGGLVAAIAVGWTAAALLHPPVPVLRIVILSGGLGVLAQAGDLFESWVKRRFGVKDSGRLIPGHGGLLDRLDALLVAAPVGAILALLAGRGVVLWQ